MNAAAIQLYIILAIKLVMCFLCKVASSEKAYLASLIKNIKYENKEKTFNIVEK